MKKTKRQACLISLLVIVLSLAFYVQAPDGMVPVTELNFSTLMTAAPQEDSSVSAGQGWYLCNSIQTAGEKFRDAMKARKTKITIMLSGDAAKRSDFNAMFNEMYDIALEHTGNGDEGDYLKWHLDNLSASFTKSTSTFEISVAYLDDASMEDQTTKAIKAVEESLPITSKDSTYEKIYTIYDYLANHITYVQDKTNLSHTAYNAIVNGKAVCQGYATLFYRMLLDYGIDNRLIASSTHAWNLVKVGGKYYECDLTWDSQGVQEGDPYEYFLKADLSSGDTSHNWKSSSMDSSVYTLARASSDYVYNEEDVQVQAVDVPTVTTDSIGKTTLKLTRKNKSVVLKWSAVKNATGYRIYRKTANGSWKKIATTSKRSYTDKSLKKGTYSYRVQAYSKSAKGSYSKSKKVKI